VPLDEMRRADLEGAGELAVCGHQPPGQRHQNPQDQLRDTAERSADYDQCGAGSVEQPDPGQVPRRPHSLGPGEQCDMDQHDDRIRETEPQAAAVERVWHGEREQQEPRHPAK
jgi:hypothetical protein